MQKKGKEMKGEWNMTMKTIEKLIEGKQMN